MTRSEVREFRVGRTFLWAPWMWTAVASLGLAAFVGSVAAGGGAGSLPYLALAGASVVAAVDGWRMATVVRLDPAGVTLAGRSRPVFIPWDELRRVDWSGKQWLRWTWDGGRVRTWTGFRPEHELWIELQRRGKNVDWLPSWHRRS